MSTETCIAIGLTISIFITSERLLLKFQCRQKSMEAFWQSTLSHIWNPNQSPRTSFSIDRCQVVNRSSIGLKNTWHWGNSSIQLQLNPGASDE